MAKPPVNWSNVSMLTPGMKNLGNQFNNRWPDRYGDSDGAIGDWQHTQGTSGHNPDDTSEDNAEWDSDSDNKSEVRAIDVDKDLNESGVTMQMVIDHLRQLPNLESVVRYMIYNGKIYKASNNFNPENYTGSSSHKEHAHFSGAYSQSSDENTTFDYRFEEVGDMAITDADVRKIWEGITWESPYDGKPRYPITYLRYAPSRDGITNDVMEEIRPELDQVDKAVADLTAKVDAQSAQIQALIDMLSQHASGIIEGLTR